MNHTQLIKVLKPLIQLEEDEVDEAGKGSHPHAGRPGKRGGSAPGKGGGPTPKARTGDNAPSGFSGRGAPLGRPRKLKWSGMTAGEYHITKAGRGLYRLDIGTEKKYRLGTFGVLADAKREAQRHFAGGKKSRKGFHLPGKFGPASKGVMDAAKRSHANMKKANTYRY